MKKFSARLISLMETLEVSGYQLAREIGSSDMSISKYQADKALPCFEFFENLVTRYPSVNLNWLIGMYIPSHTDHLFRRILTTYSEAY